MEVILTPLDYVILIVMFISTAISITRGFVREVLSIIGWLLSFYGTLMALPLMRPFAHDYIRPAWLSDIIIVIVVFILIMLAFSYFARFLTERLKNSNISIIDRLLGGVFGLARGGIIVIFAYFILLLLVPEKEQPNWITQAQLQPPLKMGTGFVIKLVPLDNLSQNLTDIDELFN